MSKTTIQVRLYPTPEQSRLLMTHGQEYISTVNVLVAAFDALSGKGEYERFHGTVVQCCQPQAFSSNREPRALAGRRKHQSRVPCR